MKILIRVSKGINKDYFNDIEKVINSLKTEEKIKKGIEFFIEYYNFKRNEGNQIINNPNDFLDDKYDELSKSQQRSNSIIYIPDMTLNLKGNFLWYSLGDPQQSVMVFSSFLYKYLIEGKLNFGAYIILVYSQYLARYTINLERSHRKSKNCLNDFCANQIEILNALKNKENVLCDECLNNIKNYEYYNIINSLVNHLNEKFYQKKEKKLKEKVKEIHPRTKKIVQKKKFFEFKSKKELESSRETWYEFEVYMAKKCANISELYKKLDKVLSKHNSTFDGYSLYEVGGGYREKIKLTKAGIIKWKELGALKEYLESKGVKDTVRKLINYRNKKFVLYDEASIVLRIIAKEKSEIPRWEESSSKVIDEIKEIFKEIKGNENNVFFTVKKLKYVGSF